MSSFRCSWGVRRPWRRSTPRTVGGPRRGRFLLVVAQRSGEVQDPAAADLYRVGVVARLLQRTRLPNGTVKVLVEGVARARVKRYAAVGAGLQATVDPRPVHPPGASRRSRSRATTTRGSAQPSARSETGGAAGGGDPGALAVLSRQVTSRFEEYVSLHRRIPDEIATFVQSIESDERRAIAIAAHVAVKHEVRQQLLEAADIPALVGGARARC